MLHSKSFSEKKKRIETSGILDRNKLTGYRIKVVTSVLPQDVTTKIHNPYRPINATNLIKFLFYLHEKKGFKTRRAFKTYYPQAKQLLAEVGEDSAERLMVEAFGKAKHAWGFDFIQKMKGPPTNEENSNSFNP